MWLKEQGNSIYICTSVRHTLTQEALNKRQAKSKQTLIKNAKDSSFMLLRVALEIQLVCLSYRGESSSPDSSRPKLHMELVGEMKTGSLHSQSNTISKTLICPNFIIWENLFFIPCCLQEAGFSNSLGFILYFSLQNQAVSEISITHTKARLISSRIMLQSILNMLI